MTTRGASAYDGAVLARLTLLSFVAWATLGQRIVGDLFGGLVHPLALAFVGLAALLWVRDELTIREDRSRRAIVLNTVGPLFALLLLLPFLGVLLDWYGLSALYSWTIVALPLAILSLGTASRRHGLNLRRAGFVAILAHGLYGLGQTLNRLGLLPGALWDRAADWDISSQERLSESYVIVGRSTGLFVNANQFGLWSCLAVVFSAAALSGRRRAIGIALGVAGVVGSQSRTAWLGLAVLAVVLVVLALRRPAVAQRSVLYAVLAAPIIAAAWLLGWLGSLIETNLVTRLTEGLSVASEGVAADRNLSGRVDSWSSAVEFSKEYPFGTFGSPQVHYEQFIDNEYVGLFLQGSVLLVAAYLLALASPIVLARRGVPHAGALGVMAAVVALASFTMQPLESTQAVTLVWLLAGIGLAARAAADRVRGDRPARLIRSADRPR